jgi:hypothetical protein
MAHVHGSGLPPRRVKEYQSASRPRAMTCSPSCSGHPLDPAWKSRDCQFQAIHRSRCLAGRDPSHGTSKARPSPSRLPSSPRARARTRSSWLVRKNQRDGIPPFPTSKVSVYFGFSLLFACFHAYTVIVQSGSWIIEEFNF